MEILCIALSLVAITAACLYTNAAKRLRENDRSYLKLSQSYSGLREQYDLLLDRCDCLGNQIIAQQLKIKLDHAYNFNVLLRITDIDKTVDGYITITAVRTADGKVLKIQFNTEDAESFASIFN